MDIILTGYKKLDDIIGGIKKKDLFIIGARPSMGKSAFALSLINNISLKNKICTCFFSLELTNEAIIKRLISYDSDMELETLKKGVFNENNFNALERATSKIANAPLYLIDSVGINLGELKKEIKELVIEQNLELVVIDYLGLLSVDKSQTEEIVKELKLLAIEMNIAIVALSQLKRDAERKLPQLKDLRVENYNAADVIILMHRDRNNYDDKKIETDLIIAKNRENNKLGTIQISFLSKENKFEE
jgi:replicative DNA helicase